jgi:hypothetical protein
VPYIASYKTSPTRDTRKFLNISNIISTTEDLQKNVLHGIYRIKAHRTGLTEADTGMQITGASASGHLKKRRTNISLEGLGRGNPS